MRLKLKEARERRGWSVRYTAKKCGVSPATISQIENGNSDPTLETYCKIAKGFGISIDNELLDSTHYYKF